MTFLMIVSIILGTFVGIVIAEAAVPTVYEEEVGLKKK